MATTSSRNPTASRRGASCQAAGARVPTSARQGSRSGLNLDVVAGFTRILDGHSPTMASRLQWRRDRRTDVALRVVDALVTRGDVALDIGALRGDYALRMLDLVGRHGSVHAFEPNPAHHDRLLALSSRGRHVEVHPFALSDRNGDAVLHIPAAGGPSAGLASLEQRPNSAVQAVTVTTRRLDDVLGGAQRVDFIKCDVEGHEDAVLGGAQDLLAREHPVLLIEIEQRHRRSDVTSAFDRLSALGYEGWALFGDGIRPLAEFDVERDQLSWLSVASPKGIMPHGYVHNFLFVDPGTDVRRLTDPAFRSARISPSTSA
jgi:FkbM family methyltransferase